MWQVSANLSRILEASLFGAVEPPWSEAQMNRDEPVSKPVPDDHAVCSWCCCCCTTADSLALVVPLVAAVALLLALWRWLCWLLLEVLSVVL